MSSSDRIPIMFGVDLRQYSGRWYEIARSPFIYESFTVSSDQGGAPPFAVECESATADYTPIETSDGLGLRIINRCLNAQGSEISRAVGVARPVSDPSLGALLKANFNNFTVAGPNGESISLPIISYLNGRTAGYWIHWLSDDYSLAIVGSPETVRMDKDPFLSVNGNQRRRFLKGQVWVLSRTPKVSRNTLQMLVDKIREIGYDPDTVFANSNIIS